MTASVANWRGSEMYREVLVFYCDFHNSAESHLQELSAKLCFGFHQSNFRRQAESGPENTDAEINWCVTYLWFSRYIRAFELDADGKTTESVRIFLLKNLKKVS